jgi:hypothetical protein
MINWRSYKLHRSIIGRMPRHNPITVCHMTKRHSPVTDMLLLEPDPEMLVAVAIITDVAVAVMTIPPSLDEVGMAGSDDCSVVDWTDGVADNTRPIVQYSSYIVNAEGRLFAVVLLHAFEIHLERYDVAMGDVSVRQKHPLSLKVPQPRASSRLEPRSLCPSVIHLRAQSSISCNLGSSAIEIVAEF